MAGGLAASYGTFALMAGRFLYPSRPPARVWQFVARVQDLAPGSSLRYRTPAGAEVTITRQGSSGRVEDFIALSSVCPHLGCRVHWEPHNRRFFCPCHNGVFDPAGKATSGPPAEAGQSLPRYPLRVENGLLLIEVQVEGFLAHASRSRARENDREVAPPSCTERGEGMSELT
jgi:nitrite reductase/ring-hydroxylating ferredoxin subunit